MPYATTQYHAPLQALLSVTACYADYAEVIDELHSSFPGAQHSPVIGFGGSYGQ